MKKAKFTRETALMFWRAAGSYIDRVEKDGLPRYKCVHGKSSRVRCLKCEESFDAHPEFSEFTRMRA